MEFLSGTTDAHCVDMRSSFADGRTVSCQVWSRIARRGVVEIDNRYEILGETCSLTTPPSPRHTTDAAASHLTEVPSIPSERWQVTAGIDVGCLVMGR